MLKDQIKELIKDYLQLNDAIAIEFNGELKVFGKGNIENYVIKLFLLQKQLPKEFLDFKVSYCNDYSDMYTDIIDGCLPVLVFLKKCNEKAFQLLRTAKKKAYIEYEQIATFH